MHTVAGEPLLVYQAKGSAGPSPHPFFHIGEGNLASVMLRQTRMAPVCLARQHQWNPVLGAFFAFPGNHFLRAWMPRPCAGVAGDNTDPFLLDESHRPLPLLTRPLFIL